MQESQENKTTQVGKPVIVDADNVEFLEAENKIIGRNNVRINYDNVVLTADAVELDTKTKKAVASGSVVLYYGEIIIKGEKLGYNFTSKKGKIIGSHQQEVSEDSGNVVTTYKNVKIISEWIEFDLKTKQALAGNDVKLQQGDTEFEGRNLTYNFETQKGDFFDVYGYNDPWFTSAESGKKVDDRRIDFSRAYLTTCEFNKKPHYRIQARRIYYYIEDKIIAKNALLFLGRVPVFYFPYWKQSLKDGRNNVTVSAGHKKEWGWFVLSSWRYYFSEQFKGNVHLDYRELKGFAAGVDSEYNTQNSGQGTIKTYHMNERDKYYANEEDKKTRNIQETERYRGQLKHRWQIDPSTLAMLEYNKMSDISFIKDYLYKEYEDDVQPVSETSLMYYHPDYNASIYARKRTNRFYSEVERLPELKFNLTSRKIQDTNLYFREQLALANLNKKMANSDIDTDANRFDTYHEFKYPTKFPAMFDWINFSPYIGTRQTYYSKDTQAQERDFLRGIHYYGFDMNTKFYRFSDYTGSPLGVEVNRLRHIVTPSIKYTYIHEPTVNSTKLGGFDGIDSIAKTNMFTFGIENHLQTKWKIPNRNELQSVDLVYFYPHVDYFHRVDPGQRNFSFISSELNVRPFHWLHLDSETVYNQYQRRFQTANIDLGASGADKWRLSIGKRYDRDINEQVTADAYYKFNRFWQLRTYIRYLSYTDNFQEQQYTVYRDLHCWLLEMTYDIKLDDFGNTQDRTFWFIFRLKAFPEETPIPIAVSYEATQRI